MQLITTFNQDKPTHGALASFLHSFVRSFAYAFVNLFIHSLLARSFVLSFIPSLSRSFVRLLARSLLLFSSVVVVFVRASVRLLTALYATQTLPQRKQIRFTSVSSHSSPLHPPP